MSLRVLGQQVQVKKVFGLKIKSQMKRICKLKDGSFKQKKKHLKAKTTTMKYIQNEYINCKFEAFTTNCRFIIFSMFILSGEISYQPCAHQSPTLGLLLEGIDTFGFRSGGPLQHVYERRVIYACFGQIQSSSRGLQGSLQGLASREISRG